MYGLKCVASPDCSYLDVYHYFDNFQHHDSNLEIAIPIRAIL
jgi:hypothetical protein